MQPLLFGYHYNLANVFVSILSRFLTFSNILGFTIALKFLPVLLEFLAQCLEIVILVNVVK